MNAVARLPLLNVTYYRDILCEIAGMFAIANKVDNVHKRPWIGFQSWRAAGRKVCPYIGGIYFRILLGILINISKRKKNLDRNFFCSDK